MKKIFTISLFILYILAISNTNLFSATIPDPLNKASYCKNDQVDTLIATSPPNKWWACNVPGAVNVIATLPGESSAEFDPTKVPGPYPATVIIRYQNSAVYGDGSTIYYEVSCIVTEPPTGVIFDVLSDICSTEPSFVLTQGDPIGGIYSGVGVETGTIFNPSLAGAGTHLLSYIYPNTGCDTTVYQTIKVLPIPVVTLDAFADVCEGDAAFVLSGGSPAGGTYSGSGVVGGIFNPVIAGIGTHTITYSITSGSCSNFATETITVNALPAVSFTALATKYCETSGDVILVGSPMDANGTFSGPGVSDNGDGTGLFVPSSSSLGNVTVTYTYTDINSCTDISVQNTEVGAELTMNGLAASYCITDAVVTVVCTPVGGSYTAFGGLTDNGDGTADFDPVTAGTGTFNIEYSYDDGTCTSTINQLVQVVAIPTPSIAGLSAEYCTNDAIVLLTGNYAPNGTFSGLGITDNGNGTAYFDPTSIAIGGPYDITYSYTNASGCLASKISQTIINGLPTATISGDATICQGDNTQINIDLTGLQPYDFTYTNGASNFNIIAYAAANYNTNVAPITDKTYTVTNVTDANGCSNVGMGSAAVSVTQQITITKHPISKSACLGSNSNFAVVANGADLTYQWQKNGVDIAGATNSVLTLNNVAAGDAAAYRCVVSSSCGGPVTSNIANLSLYTPTAITTQPIDAHLCTGENLNLVIAASGSNLTYQWKKDGIDIADGGSISGATLNTLTINGVTTANAGDYTCEVTGSCGILESDPATVEIDPPVIITSQPTSKQVCPASNTSFTVAATGTNLLFQWQKNGIDIPGETSQSLVINNVVVGDAGNYKCVISSLCGETVSSNTVSLTVNVTTQITANPVDLTECLGGNANFEVTALGTNLMYQWIKDGVNLADGVTISGALTNKLIITGLVIGDGGDYKCQITGTCGTLESNSANLVVDDAIAITMQPSNKTTCAGNNIAFSILATGSNLTYQWQKNLVNIAGATNSTLNLNSVSAADAGNYRCIVKNSCGQSLNSNAASLTIYNATAITTQPADAVECIGNTIIFTVAASGSNLNYQWYKDGVIMVDGGDISGVQTTDLIISNLDLTDVASYECNVSGDCGFLISDPAVLIIDDNISVTTQPQDIQACETSNIIFNVVALGSNLSYQWQKNGVDIAGATNSVLSLNNIAAADVASYRCVISNSCGSTLNSQAADLSLYTNTSIITQPADVTECVGNNANFIVAAAGSNLTYQWKKNGADLVDGGNISGSLTNTLNITGILAGDNGVYTCEISGNCNIVNSDPANLIINANTTISTHPVNQTVCPGANAVFNVVASGTNLSYQWQKNNVNIPGATNSGYIIGIVSEADAGVYRCIVTGDCGTVISNGALLSVNTVINISSQPIDDDICEAESAGFSVVATGTGLSYQWKFNGSDLSDGGNISGATTDNLTINTANIGNAGVYECVVTGFCGISNSDPVSLVVKEKTIITSQPQNKTVCPNDNISFTVVASGTNLMYQWQKNGIDMFGETNSTLILNNVLAGDAGIYRCVVTGDCNTITSNGASLTINTDVGITMQPSADIVCEGEVVSFNVAATGTGLTYQWRHNGIDLIDIGNISGSTTNNLVINSAVAADAGTYSCVVSGTCSSVNSNSVNLTINENVVITTSPINKTACPSEDITFSVVASGNIVSYQWQKDGIDLLGETNSGLLLSNVTAGNAGVYRCVITGDCGIVNSNGATLTINTNAVIMVQPSDNTVCQDQSAGFVLSAAGTGLSYQWKFNGSNLVNNAIIDGATTNSLSIDPVSLSNSGVYTCVVAGTCNNINSNPANLVVDENIVITDHPINLTACPGENANFSISASGTNLTYQWQKNGIDIGGETNPGLTLTGVTDFDEGIYRCVVNGNCGVSISNGASLIVDNSVVISTQPNALVNICQGDNLNLNVVATGSSLTYQWQKNGVNLSNGGNISGATSSNVVISSISESDDAIYSCIITGSCASITSNISDVNVYPTTTIIQQPVNYNTIVGADATFSVVAKGNSLLYQWQKDGVDLSDGGIISGATTPNLVLTGVTVANQGAYRCVIIGTCNTSNSNPANLTVNLTTLITSQPISIERCEGESAGFTLIASGGGLTYQWKKDGVDLSDNANISGSSLANLTLTSVSLSDAGAYTCIVNGESSVPAILKVHQNTVINTQPLAKFRCEGDNVIFTINASGSALTYQWQKNGVNLIDGGMLSGANTSSLVISSTVIADAGNYRCIVNGICGTANSSPALLTVYKNTAITTQPLGNTICENESHTFSIITSGDNLTYVWKKDGVILSDGGNVSGSNTENLVISNANLSDAGSYNCTVTGECGFENSIIAQLFVRPVTTITLQPLDASGCEGDNISFSVLATGSGLTYQWQKDGVNLINGGTISGALTPNLNITGIAAADAGSYVCVVSGACGTQNSDPARLVAYDNTVITTQPVGNNICQGEIVTLNVEAIGGNLIYQWKKDGVVINDGGNITGTNTANLNIANASVANTGNYYCEVTGDCGTENTNLAQINVWPATTIATQPLDKNGCDGENLSFTVIASGHNLIYQWQKDGVNLIDAGIVSGSTTSLLSLTGINVSDAGSYRCFVTGTCGTVNSDPAELIAYQNTLITSQPVGGTICENSAITLSVAATGDNITYQWKKGAVALSDLGNYTGTSTPNLSITSADLSDAGTYSCQVTGSCGTENSALAIVVVQKQTQIITHPSDAGACTGNNVSFSVLADGVNLSYQWQKNGVNLFNGGVFSGTNTSLLHLTGITAADAGSYRCVVTGSCGVQNSDPAILTAYNNTQITTQPISANLCEGDQIALSVEATGDNLIYQWKKNGAIIVGAITSDLIINNSLLTDAGIYTCMVSGSCGNENSSPASISIKSKTVITTQPQSVSTCEGEVVVFSITASGSNLNYQWQKDGIPLVDGGSIFGSTSSILSVNGITAIDAGVYRCVVTGICGIVNSDAANLNVDVYPSAAGAIIGSTQVCQGSNGVIYEVAAIANADYYIWDLPVGVTIISGDSTRVIEVSFSNNELGGNITVRGLNSCGYGNPSPALTITANPIPVAQAGSDQSLCVDSTYLTAAQPATATGIWSVVDGPASIQNVNLYNSFVSNLREGTNTFIWTVEKNGCSSSDTVVVINNHVNVDAGTDITICSKNITLEGSSVPSGAIGSWSVLVGTASFNDGNDPVTIATDFATDINVLKWTVSKGGCSSFDTVIIDNQRPTQAYAGIDQLICIDSTILNANTPIVGTGEWTVVTGAATFVDPTNPNTIVRNLSQGDNILRWTTSNGICNTIDEVTISNNQINVNAGVDQIICDRTTTLTADPVVSGIGNWSVISGSAAFVNNNFNNTIVTSLAKGINKLAWNITIDGCISRDTVSITNDSPTTAQAGSDQVLAVDFTTLQGNIPTIGTGQWSLISGSAIITNPNVYNTNVTNLALGDNIFRWTITHNSCISTDDVIITNFMSTATDAGADQTICSNETILDGNEPVFGFGEWSVVQGSASFQNVNDPKTKVTGLAKGDNTLKWSVWENGWTSDEVVITNDSPTSANAGVDQILCADSTFMAGNEPNIGSGKWTVISGSGTFVNDTIYNTKIKNLAKGQNIFKWTITNKSCSTSDLVIITNDLPTIAIAGIDRVICTNTITLSPNTPSFGTGEWSVIGGAANFSGNTVSNLASGTNTLRWTIVNNACVSYDDIVVTNNEPSNANAGADKIICIDSLNLAANIPIVGTGVWSIQSGSATIDNLNSPTTKVTNLHQGINVFRWTVSYNGCTKLDEVTVNNALIEATTGIDQDICNESTILEANNPGSGTGTWTVLGGSGAAVFQDAHQPDTRVTGLDKGANILRWTITNEICVSSSDVVITNSLPTNAFAGPDQAICIDNAVLQANKPIVGNGEWSILSGSATITNPNSETSTITNLDYGVNTLRWTITNGSCISSDEVVISNNSTVGSYAGIDQVLCSDSAFLYANIPTNGIGNWSVVSGSATFANNNLYNTKISNIGKGVNIIRWVISNGECSSKDEVSITNNSPSKAIAGADQTVCGSSTYLQANIPTVGNGRWSLVSGAGTFVNNTLNNTQVIELNPGNNTLRWTTENEGCISSDDVVINNDLPYEADAGADFEVCGTSTPLYANDPVFGVGEWKVISGSATFDNSSTFDANVSNLGFGANTLRWTITYDHCVTSDEIIVTNNKTEVYAGIDQTINTSNTLLAASNPSSGIGNWSIIGGSGSFEKINNAITQVTNLGAGLNTFRWSVNVNGCLSYDDVSITYNVPPIASFVITKSEGCPPLDVYFVNNSMEGLSFEWDFNDGTTSDQVTVKHTFTDPGFYKPKLTVIGQNGEVVVRDTTIEVYPQPEASFLIVNKKVYIPEEEAIFINTSKNASTYEWEFGDGSRSTDSDPKYKYETEGVYDIVLHAWSDKNCYDSIKIHSGVEVYESGTIQFPNAFTPNLDGSSGGYYNPNDFSNDVFYPIGEGLENYHLEVFNRWGIIVFESNDIMIGWDGYYENKLLEEGVYVWKVTGKYNNGKDFKKVGTVLLLH